jgi:hypothetical protein
MQSMRGKRWSALRWILVVTLGLVALLQLSCTVPSQLTRAHPTSAPTPAPPSTPAITPTTLIIIVKISEQDANLWLKGQRPSLAQGIKCEDLRMKVRDSGITLSARLRIAQLQGVSIPVEIQTRPVVLEEQVRLEVLDIQLGGFYAPMSDLFRSMLSARLADALDLGSFLAQRGLHVAEADLEDGFIVFTCVPPSSWRP